jgi:arylsulfatase A-like enzyme
MQRFSCGGADVTNRRDFLKTTAAAAVGLSSVAAKALAQSAGRASKKPNLLFVFGDQWRRQAMGFMNQDPVLTPVFDRFAGESLVLDNAVSGRPVCSPYRASLITGRYPISHGVTVNCYRDRPGNYLRPDGNSVADALSAGGYHTGYIGKWHLDDPARTGYRPDPALYHGRDSKWDAYTPAGPYRMGFDFWYSYGCFNDHLAPHYWTGDDPTPLRIEQWSPEHETDVAIDYIKRRDRERPFALFMSWNPPHGPYEKVPERYRDLFRDKDPLDLLNRPNVKFEGDGKRARTAINNYFAAIAGMDENFGRLLACLEDEKIADDTIVVFTADHGDMMGSHGRLGKTIYYEESNGIPFLIRWPGQVKTGREGLLLNAPDVMPTLLGLAGAVIPSTVEGVDYSPLLRGEEMPRPTSAFLQLFLYQQPVENSGYRGVRTERHKYVVVAQKTERKRLLFDLESDPYELTPIWRGQGHDDLIQRLEAELADWLQRTGDPFIPRPDGLSPKQGL